MEPGSPDIFVVEPWSPAFLGQSPGALNPFGTLLNIKYLCLYRLIPICVTNINVSLTFTLNEIFIDFFVQNLRY